MTRRIILAAAFLAVSFFEGVTSAQAGGCDSAGLGVLPGGIGVEWCTTGRVTVWKFTGWGCTMDGGQQDCQGEF